MKRIVFPAFFALAILVIFSVLSLIRSNDIDTKAKLIEAMLEAKIEPSGKPVLGVNTFMMQIEGHRYIVMLHHEFDTFDVEHSASCIQHEGNWEAIRVNNEEEKK